MRRPPLRILDLVGSPEARGHAHGAAFADEIRTYTDERVRLAGSEFWTGGRIGRGDVLDIARSCLPAHEAHSADLYAELCGIAEGAGITPEEAVVVGGFTDFVDTVRSVVGGRHPDGPQVRPDPGRGLRIGDDPTGGHCRRGGAGRRVGHGQRSS